MGTKRAKTCMHCVCIPTELCIPPLVVGYQDWSKKKYPTVEPPFTVPRVESLVSSLKEFVRHCSKAVYIPVISTM